MTRNVLYTFPLVAFTTLFLGCGGSSDDTVTADVSTDDDDPIVVEETSNALVINEIVASAADDGNDWIEFYATSDISDLSIYTIVDDSADREAQALPAIALSAGEFVVVQAIDADDTPPEDQYYVTFKLGGDDAVTLYENAVEIDLLDWEDGDAAEGYSYGLYVDATGTAQTMLPTAGAANEELTEEIVVLDAITNNDAQLRVNEIVAKDANDGYDWIEFYASGDTAVFLGDYSVADEDGELFALPSQTISPGELYRVYASGEAVDGLETVDFKLGSSDQVSLFLGTDLIDQLSWNKKDALIGTSYGRFPDGSDRIATLLPTATTANVTATHGPLVINEVVASQNDDSNDWFELYNNSTSAILLSDYQIIDSSDDIDPVTLPEITWCAVKK